MTTRLKTKVYWSIQDIAIELGVSNTAVWEAVKRGDIIPSARIGLEDDRRPRYGFLPKDWADWVPRPVGRPPGKT